jgi:hypothetical protein
MVTLKMSVINHTIFKDSLVGVQFFENKIPERAAGETPAGTAGRVANKPEDGIFKSCGTK